MSLRKLLHVLVLASAGLPLSHAAAATTAETTDRLVIKYQRSATIERAGRAAPDAKVLGAARAQALTRRLGRRITYLRQTATGRTIFQLAGPVSLHDAYALAARATADAAVLSAEPDLRTHALSTPSDPYALDQWSNQTRDLSNPGGANLWDAWSFAGSGKVTVAVIDTGMLAAPDLSGAQMAGYDFISDLTAAGDGDGRDADPSDPGDYCSSTSEPSSWHGTSVASIIAAAPNNGTGIAGGAALNALVLHVRVLGRCGGYLSDAADAITWAVGRSVTGVPANATPARVLNLSLGSSGLACPSYMQDAVNGATAANAVVVVAAGNEGQGSIDAPANCVGVIAVGAHTKSGDLASYSNHASSLTLTAPGGGTCMTQTTTCQSDATVVVNNDGTQGPGSFDVAYFTGTSAATPHVSAAVAMMLAVDPDLTPAQVKAVLVATAKPQAADSFCAANPGECGAGMLDAMAAVQSVTAPVVTITGPTSPVVGKASVRLVATPSGSTGPFTYAWTQTAGPAVTLQGADTATPAFTAPAIKGAPMQFRLTVTTPVGQTTTNTFSVSVNNLPELTSATTASGTAGVTLSIPLTATDADGDTVYYTLVDGPAGASVSGSTIDWPTPTQGNVVFKVLVADTQNATTTEGTVSTIEATIAAAPRTSSGTGSSTSGASGGSGGSGGGGMSWPFLIGLVLAVVALRGLKQRAPAQTE